MYKLLIVDDELFVREGLSKFDWGSMDIELAGVCEHGMAAFQVVMENPVDIILSDIRMPIMGGLELIEKVNQHYPFIKMVVLTGYDDFDYARTCIHNGVLDYLLKPIDNGQLIKTFDRVVQKLNHEKQHQLRIRELERKARLSAKLLRKDFLKKLLYSDLSAEEIEEGSSYGEIILESGLYTVCMLQMDNMNEKRGMYSEKDWKLIIFALDNILTEIWEDTGRGYFYIGDEKGTCYLLVVDKKLQADASSLKNLMNDTINMIYRIGGLLRTTLSCAIGTTQSEESMISISRCHAEQALNVKKACEDIIFYEAGKCDANKTDRHRSGQRNAVVDELSNPIGSSSKKHIIETAKRYIDSNFMYSITLSDVAGHAYVNASYLSYLFMEVTGINFVNYLTKRRMEKAKELLRDPQYKIYEIGEMVGYENPRYFSEIFKKSIGKTPFEYRSNC